MMLSWTCMVAGGPEHGAVQKNLVLVTKDSRHPVITSDGLPCRPVLVAYDGLFSHALFAHPEASDRDMDQAEARLKRVIEAMRVEAYRVATGCNEQGDDHDGAPVTVSSR